MVVVEAGVGVVVGTVVEAESKTPVALTSPMLMRLHEVGGLIFLRTCHTLVCVELSQAHYLYRPHGGYKFGQI